MEPQSGEAQEKTATARCNLFHCVCSWHRSCSPRIPRVAPGREYVCLPAGADDRPAWSLLVGFISEAPIEVSESSLGLHRFKVARCGRVIGWSGDALDVVHSVETKGGNIPTANAALNPDGRSLCLFSEYLDTAIHQLQATPVAQRLQLLTAGGNTSMLMASALPSLPLEPAMLCRPVSAAGRLWAPSVCPIAMHRLDEVAGGWEQVGAIRL